MSVPVEIGEIQGAAELEEWFGYWPSFHDAEIIGLHLNRKGSSSLRVHTWEMTKEIDDKGYYVLAKHILVEFIFEADWVELERFQPSGCNLRACNREN